MDLNSDSWLSFVESLQTVVVEVHKYTLKNVKPAFLQEFFHVLLKCQALDKDQKFDLSCFEELKSSFNKNVMKLLRALLPTENQVTHKKRKLSGGEASKESDKQRVKKQKKDKQNKSQLNNAT